MKLPTVVELSYQRLPKNAKKSAINFARYQVKKLKLAIAEADEKTDFKIFKDFLYGRLIEAEETLEMLQHFSKRGIK